MKTFDDSILGKSITKKLYKVIPDNKMETVLESIRDVLMEGRIIKIILDVNKPYIYYEKRAVSGEEEEAAPATLDAAVKSVEMEELDYHDDISALAVLAQLFDSVRHEGYEVSHILTGSSRSLLRACELTGREDMLFGVPLSQSIDDVPNDVVIVCGSPHKESFPEDIKYVIKGTF